MLGICCLVAVEVIFKRKHQIVLQETVCAAKELSDMSHQDKDILNLLGKLCSLRELKQLAFALLLQPRVRHRD